MYLVLNFKSNLGTYGHDLLAYERDARGANLHRGVNLLPGANCAHEHEDNFIPLLKQTTNSIMEILRNIGSHFYSWNANRLRYTICTALEYHPDI